MATKHIRKKTRGCDEASRLRAGLDTSFFTVNATQTPIEQLEGASPELGACHRALVSGVRESGLSVALDVLPPSTACFSRGIDGGAINGDLSDYAGDAGTDWSATPMHLVSQQRSPKIIFARKREGGIRIIERKIKGGGLRSMKHTGNLGATNSEVITQKPGVYLPFHCSERLMRRIDETWMMSTRRFSSRSIWGGVMRGDAGSEAVRLLGMHRLLMSVDGGEPAGVQVPVGVLEVDEVPLVEGGVEKRIAIEDYFTNPDYLPVKELLSYAYEARRRAEERRLSGGEQDTLGEYVKVLEENDPYFMRRREYHDKYYHSVLSEEDSAGIEGTGFFDSSVKEKLGDLRLEAGRIIRKVIGLSQLHSVGGDDLRINEALDVVTGAKTREEVDLVLKLIYANYGEDLVLPEQEPDLSPASTEKKSASITQYLSQVYRLNKNSADRIMEGFTKNFFRDIGALHGAGGFMGGYEISFHREDFEMLGAQGGGATELRNTDVNGNKHDFDEDVYIPFLNFEGKRPSPGLVREMQLKDLFLAEVTLGRFNTLLTGKVEVPREYNLDAPKGFTYMALENLPRGKEDRLGRLEKSLGNLRSGEGPYGSQFSDHFRKLQLTRDRVYGEFLEKGRGFGG